MYIACKKKKKDTKYRKYSIRFVFNRIYTKIFDSISDF